MDLHDARGGLHSMTTRLVRLAEVAYTRSLLRVAPTFPSLCMLTLRYVIVVTSLGAGGEEVKT